MPSRSHDLPPAAVEALTRGRKIEAIRIVRQEWHIDLKGAKDAVDRYVEARPDLASQIQGASKGTKRLLLFVLVFTVAYLLFRIFHQ
jgi:hypothetical protein